MAEGQRSLVIGSRGQDGSLLFDLLQKRGDLVVGLDRGPLHGEGSEGLPTTVDVSQAQQVYDLIRTFAPREIYYLAARHQSSEDGAVDPRILYEESVSTNVTGLLHCLEGIRRYSPTTRIFYASSSHVFGESEHSIQDETTSLRPNSIYGMTKTFGMQLCQSYRVNHGVFAAVGILYNHESPLRPPHFLSKKIVTAALKIKAGLQECLTLGSLSSMTDWGYAPEYVEAMTRILGLPTADVFVVSSGRSHSVRDFVELAFQEVGLDWQPFVKEQPGLLSRRSYSLVGNSKRLRDATGWEAKTDLKSIIHLLLSAEAESSKLMRRTP